MHGKLYSSYRSFIIFIFRQNGGGVWGTLAAPVHVRLAAAAGVVSLGFILFVFLNSNSYLTRVIQ